MICVQDDGAGGIVAAESVTDEWLSAYIDGELTGGVRRVIERLIASDDREAKTMASLERFRPCLS